MKKNKNTENYFLSNVLKTRDDIRYLHIYKEATMPCEKYVYADISTSSKDNKEEREVLTSLYKRYDFQDSDVLNSKESNTRKLKAKYENHIKLIQKIDEHGLSTILTKKILNSSNIEEMFKILAQEIELKMFDSLRNNLNEIIAQESTISINYESLLNYLYILPSKKIQKSEIAIDNTTGKIVIFYNSDDRDFYSKKISIISNAKDFTVSIISRKDGLAKLSGVYASKFPEAYYKIESIMETLI